jgi:hypothetical protein
MCGGPSPISIITDPISEVLGTDGGGGGILGGLADLDKAVGNTIPGGWATVGAAALLAAGIADPELLAMADEGALSEEALSGAGYDPTVVAQQIDPYAGLSANAPVDTTLSQEAAASMGSGAGTGGSTASSLGSLTDPSLTTQIGAPTTSGGTFGSITAPLEGSGAIPGAGATTLPGGGLTGALPANVLVGDGTLGTTLGATYMSAGPGQFALDAFGNPILANSVGLEGFAPSSSLSLSDLNNARKAYGLAKSLLGAGTATTAGRSALPTGAGAGTGTGTGAGAGLEATTSIPKGTFVQGKQIAAPLSSKFDIPVQAASNIGSASNPAAEMALIQNAATGGIMHLKSGGDPDEELSMKPVFMRGKQTQHSNLFGLGGIPLFPTISKAEGGSIPANFSPQFYSEGGLGSMKHSYVRGAGTGTSDSIPAMLSDGEFVIPADVVSSLGDGSNDGGAKILDSFLTTIRSHKKKHDAKHLPAQSKGALGYLLEAKRKVKT